MKDRALQAWKDKKSKQRTHMKALGYDANTEDEDDDDSDGEDMMFGFNNVSNPNIDVRPTLDNSSHDMPNLEHDSDTDIEDDPDLDQHMVHLLNDAAQRRYRQKSAEAKAVKALKALRVPKTPKSPVALTIKSLADLDKPAAREIIHALPRDRKSLTRLAKLCPEKEEVLGLYERWVMADSGSSLHAMDISKELPGFEHLIVPIPEGKKGRGAETASGDRVEIRGTVALKGHIDGNLHTVPFNDMPTTMPIASMRQTIKKGNDLHITPEGGFIRNRKTGEKINLHERGGVYFFKMKFLPPSDQPQPVVESQIRKNRSLGFARPA